MPPPARHDTHIVVTIDLSDGASIAGLRGTLNYLVRRHEVLRTTYHFDGETDPRQRVHPPGALPLSIASTDRGGTETSADVIERLSTTDFDLSEEWPVRACVITASGQPKQLVLVLNHMAFDAWTVDRLHRELEALGAGIAAGRPVILDPIRHQPLDLARYESSAGAIAAKDGALAYWRDEIAQMPADMFSLRRTADVERTARAATLTSPAMLDAGRRIVSRHHVWPSLVYLSAYAMVMAAYTGSGKVAHLTFTGNRESSSYNDVMTCMSSPLLMQVDCSDNPPFTEVLRRAAERFEYGKRYAYMPFDELVELLSRETFRRGQLVRTGSEVNVLSFPAQVSHTRCTTVEWNATPTAWACYGSDTLLRISEVHDAVVVTLKAASTVMDADAMERFLRGYEAVLLVHDDPSVDLRVADVARMIGFAAPVTDRRPGRHGAIDLGEVEVLLRGHPAVHDVRIRVEDSGRLVADVVAGVPVTIADLRSYVLGRLHHGAAVRSPDWFRVVRRLVGEDLPITEGDGRQHAFAEAVSDGERAVASVVAEANGLREVSMSDSYAVAGGRVLRIPRVLAALREQGWEGVTVYQVAGGQPLRAIASLLTRTVMSVV